MTGHRRLGLLTLGLFLVHGLLFFLAVSARSGSPAWGLWVPKLGGGFYEFHVSLGVLALGFLVPVVLAGALRRTWPILRWLHRGWPVVFVLAFLHATSIGTDTRVGPILLFYVFIGVTLALALAARVGMAAGRWRQGFRAGLGGDRAA